MSILIAVQGLEQEAYPESTTILKVKVLGILLDQLSLAGLQPGF